MPDQAEAARRQHGEEARRLDEAARRREEAAERQADMNVARAAEAAEAANPYPP